MPTFTDLRNFGIKLVDKANEWHIPFQLLQYSAEIGCFVQVPTFHRMNKQTKYILLFRGDAFDDMQVVIDAFSPLGRYSLKKNEDSRQKKTQYGRDVYQNVTSFTLYQESASSSEEYDAATLKDAAPRMVKAQRKAFLNQDDFDESTLEQELSSIKDHLENAYSHLIDLADESKTLWIKRNSGVAHKIKLKPNTGAKKVSFSNILILFGNDSKFPVQADPGKSKGGGNPSISEQYKANPSKFKYYDKFGIFEVYDK
ncbi:hypothetical protein ACSVHR_18125 [Acinetobacter nosocomialis]|uniref:hypothetical protein n=1 Tax=Acinetobacter nosocomialis TaxID=106654 RepID=UPI003F5FE86B